jgi:hypothetical protein
MHTAFRQGIILSPYDTNKHPTFLRVVKNTAFPGRYDVDLIGEYSLPVITTLAFGQSEVLLNVDTVQKAICSFGSSTPDAVGTRYWIYQKYNIASKVISYAVTPVAPVYSPTAPPTISNQLWFDTGTKTMYLWSGISWQAIVGVVLGTFESDATVQCSPFGSSAGLTYTHGTLSTIKLYVDTNTLRDDSVLMDSLQHEYYPIESLYVDANFNNKNNIIIPGTASVAIPEFTYVKLTVDGAISPASYSDIGSFQLGIVTEAVPQNQSTNVVISGLVSYPGWNFSTSGASVWVGSGGAVVTSDPAQAPLKLPIGKTVSRHSISIGLTSGVSTPSAPLGSGGGVSTPSPVIAANATSIINLPIANGTDSIAFGAGAVTNSQGSIAQASGVFSGLGDAQAVSYVLRNITTNATPLSLYLDGISESLLISDNTTMVFEGLVVARSQTSTDAAGFSISGLITKQSGANTLEFVGTPSVSVISRSNPAWDIVLAINTFTGALQIRAVGVSSEVIHWVANIKTAEVK